MGKVEAVKYLLNEWMNEYRIGTAITNFERNNSKKKIFILNMMLSGFFKHNFPIRSVSESSG